MTGAEWDELMTNYEWTAERYLDLLAAVVQQARRDLQSADTSPWVRDSAEGFIQALQEQFRGVNYGGGR